QLTLHLAHERDGSTEAQEAEAQVIADEVADWYALGNVLGCHPVLLDHYSVRSTPSGSRDSSAGTCGCACRWRRRTRSGPPAPPRRWSARPLRPRTRPTA